jgi:hypothetical protein
MLYSIQELREKISPFIEFVRHRINLQSHPRIRMVQSIQHDGGQASFATYSPHDNVILVVYKDRHIMDILRSLAHEMIHARQNEKHALDAHSGRTGSPQENQANAWAGVLMRDWARQNPDLF